MQTNRVWAAREPGQGHANGKEVERAHRRACPRVPDACSAIIAVLDEYQDILELFDRDVRGATEKKVIKIKIPDTRDQCPVRTICARIDMVRVPFQ